MLILSLVDDVLYFLVIALLSSEFSLEMIGVAAEEEAIRGLLLLKKLRCFTQPSECHNRICRYKKSLQCTIKLVSFDKKCVFRTQLKMRFHMYCLRLFIESAQVPSFSDDDGLGFTFTRLTKTRHKETAATDEEY